MPRLHRTVFAGLPHHVTQRGNRREDIFFTDEDREVYLSWLREYSDKRQVEVLAYCIMTNHIHLIAVPATDDGLQQMLKPLHMRYAQRINRKHGWKGHLWQGRFFSSPLDEAYLWAAVRYVERNPVRAGMERRAEDYCWSSAAAHCGKRSDGLLNLESSWSKQFAAIEDWSDWLAEGDEPQGIQILRQNADKGLPCGNAEFVQRLGMMVGRQLECRPQGRPRKTEEEIKG
ncbi:MAG: transposase [Syntrophobacterales bacterium CG_4_8_14_3_um_filter_58_8]|nr:MAG: transposase [Syntrophobacterales bacterium CG03_land_8_20_14_0_80_58_14]PJC73094.1 MAG: transposase [Syntrophobacterales bacterium CG_4_8_14_3_um_filter_58_8]